jgi:hypothetical protein
MNGMATVSVFCPPMQIVAVDSGHKKTAAEPMVATIALPSKTIVIPNVVIPPTLVVKQRLWRWLVSACVGQGNTADASIVVQLPPELTLWDWGALTMVAQPVVAPVTLLLADGSRWTGSVDFPACRISNILSSVNIAEAITATGSLSQAGGFP